MTEVTSGRSFKKEGIDSFLKCMMNTAIIGMMLKSIFIYREKRRDFSK